MQAGLETRVERLERENRRLKRGAFLALVVLGGAILLGQTSVPKVSDVIRTKQLDLVDEAGRARATLEMLEGVGPELVMSDESGRTRVRLVGGTRLSGLSLNDDAGALRAAFAVMKSNPSLAMYANETEARVHLTAYADGSRLTLHDGSGRPQAVLSAEANGPYLGLEDAEGYSATLGATRVKAPATGIETKRSAASLALVGKSGKILWQAPE